MHKLPRNLIRVDGRQRSGETKSFRDRDLRESIQARGLFHPIVVHPLTPVGTGYRLIAGGRRLANIDWIAEDKQTFHCNRIEIEPGAVPCILLSDLDPIELLRAEFEENARREALPWQDAVRALATIEELEKQRNPKATTSDVARIIAEPQGRAVSTVRQALVEATIVSKHLVDPAIAQARNVKEAYALVMRKEEAVLRTIQAKQLNLIPATTNVILGDCCAILPTLPPGTVDLLLADPPYAISAGDAGFRSRTVHHHNYEDTEAAARRVITSALLDGFRVCKPGANAFVFCDINLWTFLSETAARAGWTPFRTPIIWAKSDGEGLAPWGRQGFRRTYELIFFATKGQRGLISSPVDILRHNRVSRSDRDYGPEKPTSLLKELITCSTMPRDLVLDPCCGSGNSLLAALELNRSAIGIEKEPAAYNLTMAKLAGASNANIPPPPPSASEL